jgi:hypothetical protein
MLLKGSCHCRAVRFSVESHQPVPFMRCYCSICRKTAGSGGFAINLGADYGTMKVQGREHLGVYRAKLRNGRRSQGQRHFCRECGSPLWLWDPRWPELVHPQAGAIDTPLPAPPKVTHMMLGSKPEWVGVQVKRGDAQFDEYPDESLAQWHERTGQTR